MQEPSTLPPTGLAASFSDSLALRAKHLRFRGIGNPYAFLSDIGIVPIKEFIYRGATIIDLAEAVNLPITTIRTWIEENDFGGDIDEASVLSAEGYIAQGERMLKAAVDKFQLSKAKAMIEHGRFMASKKDKKTYGNTPDVMGGAAAVHYNFIIGGQNVQINTRGQAPDAPVDPVPTDPFAPPPAVVFKPAQKNPFVLDNVVKPSYLPVHSNLPAIAPAVPSGPEDTWDQSSNG